MKTDKYITEYSDEEIGQVLQKKIEDYFNYIVRGNLNALYRRSYEYYHSAYFNRGDIGSKGAEGELKKSFINHYRNVLQHILSMTTQQRLNLEPQAINSDYESLAQIKVARDVLSYYMRFENVEKYINQAVETALYLGEGHLYIEWDFWDGKEVSRNEQGEIEYSGKLKLSNLIFNEVIRDYNVKNFLDNRWFIVTQYVNKYELATKFPKAAEEIKSQSDDLIKRFDIDISRERNAHDIENDNIPVFTFLHKKTKLCPDGEQIVFLGDGTVLSRYKLPYSCFPLISILPQQINQTNTGYTLAFDLLQLQTIYNSLMSTIITNQNAFGTQNILIPDGCNLDIDDLSGGLRGIKFNPAAGKPEPLQILSTPREIFEFLNQVERLLSILSGVNSVTRGDPENNLKSGSALALVQSMAIQFMSNFQNAYASFVEESGSLIIDILKEYCSVPQATLISGKNNKYMVKEFKGEDIGSINKIIVNMGNPLQKLPAGRVAMAENFMDRGVIKTIEEYLEVVESGNIEPMIEGERDELLLIKMENDSIRKGEVPLITLLDNHGLHIKEHKNTIATPENRENAKILDALLEHTQMHIDTWRTADPDLLMALGIQPLAQPMPMEGQPIPGQPEVLSAMIPPDQQPIPNMPNMPNNPLEGVQ